MLKAQLEILQLWYRAGEALREAAATEREDRGEVAFLVHRLDTPTSGNFRFKDLEVEKLDADQRS